MLAEVSRHVATENAPASRAGLTGRSLALVVAVAVLAALPFQGSRPLFESSEGRYALAAQEMLATGNWLLPTLDGESHYTKPPLTYWILAGSMGLFGENAWGARLPAVLALAAMALGTASIGTAWLGPRVGTWAGVLLATGWLPLTGANTVTTDIYLAAFTTLGMAAFVLSTQAADDHRRDRWLFAMWLAFGAAFLTKGPAALLVPLALLAWRAFQPRTVRPRFATPAGLGGFAVIGLTWFIYAIGHEPELVSYFLRVELWGRLNGSTGHHSAWSAVYLVFLPLLLISAGPATIAAIVVAAGRRADPDNPGTSRAAFKLPSLVWWWLLVPLFVLVVQPSKLPLYVLPLAVPVALATAAALVPRMRTHFLVGLVVASTVVAWGAKAWSAGHPSAKDLKSVAAVVAGARRGAARDTVPVVLATKQTLYSLQFYLHDRVVRPPASRGSADPVEFAIATVREFRARQAGPRIIVVGKPADCARVAIALKQDGLAGITYPDHFWDVLVVNLAANSETQSLPFPGGRRRVATLHTP